MFSSRRLPWSGSAALNPLAVAEQARRAAGQEVLDLTVSNPTAVGLGVSAETLAGALVDGAGQSGRGPLRARAARAPGGAGGGGPANTPGWARPSIPPHIVLSASSSESYAWLFKLLANPGDAVLVPEPSYPLFGYLAGLEALQLRPLPPALRRRRMARSTGPAWIWTGRGRSSSSTPTTRPDRSCGGATGNGWRRWRRTTTSP